MRAIVFPVLCVCIVLLVPVSVSAQKSRSCTPAAIRAAAAKQVAPYLVGCRYDEVAVPLVRYFSIFPVLTKTPGATATSTILEQSPVAGAPLEAGGQLALSVSAGSVSAGSVSVGPSSVPETANLPAETVSGEAAVPAVMADAATVSEAPADLMVLTAASEDASPAPVKTPAGVNLFRPALFWIWGAILGVGTAVALIFRGRHRRSEYGYDRVPKVAARLEYGPGRLSTHGPLIVSRETGQ
jgi:hypothetical protein